ncbi:MAG TPA: GAP family protein [Solirubrobacteraceae bacterium]|nr:GAP family protein [Solirubrobacteraceae bacterium]
MPSEAISLALAASIYPPAVAAVIALGRGSDVRLRVLLLVSAALVTVFVTGSLMLLLFEELGATSQQQRTFSSGLYIAGGVALLWLAARLRHPGPAKPKKEPGTSKTERYLESRRLVLLLGVILYVVPSPIYVGAVKAIADTNASTSQQLAYLAVTVLIMLWLVEIPMLMLLAFPRRASAALESINNWFARNGRLVAVLAAAGAGVYLIVVGLIELI